MLTVTIDHMKEGYLRRNGLPRSSLATVTEHWIRHGDFLTVAVLTTDPVYLTEPFIRTTDYELNNNQHVPPYPCEMVQEIERASNAGAHGIVTGAQAQVWYDAVTTGQDSHAGTTPPSARIRLVDGGDCREIRMGSGHEHLLFDHGAGRHDADDIAPHELIWNRRFELLG